MFRFTCMSVAAIAITVMVMASFASAQSSATIAGSVKDAQGGVIPGATITLVSETRGTTFETQSNEAGDFVFSSVPGDTYTVRVAMDGFRTSERKGVAASPGDRVAVPPMTVEVGELAETILVTGDAPMIQSQTGERSFTVAKEQVENLPITLRYFGQFATLAPGVVSTGTNRFARLDGARTNYMLDGISSVNTGGNQPGLEERRLSTSKGRRRRIKRNGADRHSDFRSPERHQPVRGSCYDIERLDGLRTAGRTSGRQRQSGAKEGMGVSIGPGRQAAQEQPLLFYSEQFSPRTIGGAVNRFRVPTLLERQGDFSQTTDNAGALFNLIRDPSTNLPCTAADNRGCFRDGGVLGRIPQNRLYGLGMNILKATHTKCDPRRCEQTETVAPDSAVPYQIRAR